MLGFACLEKSSDAQGLPGRPRWWFRLVLAAVVFSGSAQAQTKTAPPPSSYGVLITQNCSTQGNSTICTPTFSGSQTLDLQVGGSPDTLTVNMDQANFEGDGPGNAGIANEATGGMTGNIIGLGALAIGPDSTGNTQGASTSGVTVNNQVLAAFPATGSGPLNGFAVAVLAEELAGAGVGGGSTSQVTINNSGLIQPGIALSSVYGTYGLLGLSQAGAGLSGSQGGNAGTVTIDNSGEIATTSNDCAILPEQFACENPAQQQNLADATPVTVIDGAGGIIGAAIGGAGNGGASGGSAGGVSVTDSALVFGSYNWQLPPASATPIAPNYGLFGILGLSEGGAGGSNYNGNGGVGGNASPVSVTLTKGAVVDLYLNAGGPAGGAYAMATPILFPNAAVAAVSLGGAGGAGYSDTGHSGNNGGAGAAATLALTDADIAANAGDPQAGGQVAGAMALVEGGAGGQGGCNITIDDCKTTTSFSFENGGSGGDAGGVATLAVNAVTQPVQITTSGNNSPALLAAAIGGAGGAGGDLNDVADTDGGGKGGAGGTVQGSVVLNVTGGSGREVTVNVNPSTITGPGNSPGVAAIAQGGAGGRGGEASTDFGSVTGGSGNAGGAAGDVTVNLIWTDIYSNGADAAGVNADSPGILAASFGGAGGYGGEADGSAGTGGIGGNGGNAGNVSATIQEGSAIITQGNASDGILAESVGGAAGNGNSADGTTNANGGHGGIGGNAGNVTVSNNATIITSGDAADGILADSGTGDGGAGGGTSGGFSGSAGSGSGSGSPGSVNVTNYYSITTSGANADGVLAEAIGGAAGSGGEASGIFVVGGTGGVGSNGGLVNFTSQNGNILTSGLSAPAVLEQSIGGGGGSGGLAAGIALAVGGSGGAGGNAATVTGTLNGGSITTQGDQSPGLEGQSIGGGGGNGGNASTAGFFASVSLGGSGALGGNGGLVNLVSNGADITTTGTNSPGLEAQSIGGGGGNGGNSLAVVVGVGLSGSEALGGTGGAGGSAGEAAASVIGGSIETGQTPLLVTGSLPANTSAGSCTSLPCNSLPIDSYGALVQSIGGGGGLGGSSLAEAITIAPPVAPNVSVGLAGTFSMGGSGGAGGYGGLAQFSLSDGGSILTAGQGADGVAVQSIGGGGGAGGDASALSAVIGFGSLPGGLPATGGAQLASTLSFTVGGNGGDGNGAGDVNVALGGTVSAGGSFTGDAAGQTTSITTYGDYADGVLAQSIAGGGGNAGWGSSNTQNQGSGVSLDIAVTLGSSGGTGGGAGVVTLDDFAGDSINTWGSGAVGLIAQSIGGGGGTSQGGSVFAEGDNSNLPVNFRPGVNLALGVPGAGGGDGNTVNVDIGGGITTHGGGATGVLAQSIGGGGGLAGSQGSDGSADNPVIEATDTTEAISNVANLLSKGQVPISITGAVSIGAQGGGGGDAGAVGLHDAGSITTYGDWADGILEQSVGGGGGDGGTAAATGTGAAPELTINGEYGVGGAGGSAGNGNSTNLFLAQYTKNGVLLSPTIVTAGYAAAGIDAQSIGGGGGLGGDGSDAAIGTLNLGGGRGGSGSVSGNGGPVALTLNVPQQAAAGISTAGDAADAIELQSIGAGGGTAGFGSKAFVSSYQIAGSLSLADGGGAGAAGNGGTVTFGPQTPGVPEYFNISTSGNDAFGILAQSIGGGGGIDTAQQSASTITVALGGAGSSGDGGAVSVTLPASSSITTTGIAGMGIVAQSIGGGGGVARVINPDGYADGISTGSASASSGDPEISFDPAGIVNGPGGALAVAPRVVAESIGSGAVAAPAAATVPGVGNGGQVSVTDNGTISVSGQDAIGILAQSLGGGGGLELAGNTVSAAIPASGPSSSGGNVNVTVNGPVTASGTDGIGVLGESNGNGNVAIAIDNSVIASGAGGVGVYGQGNAGVVVTIGGLVKGATGVEFDDGAGNQLFVNSGATLAADTVLGDAVKSGGQGVSILNNGNLTGSLELQSSTGELTNNGTFTAGPIIDGSVTNNGVMNIGIPGATPGLITQLNGGDNAFTQSSTGQLGITIDSVHDKASMLYVNSTSGNGLDSLGGLIVPVAASLLPGTVLFLQDSDLPSDNGLAVQNPLLFSYSLVLAAFNGQIYQAALSPAPSFLAPAASLTPSQVSLARFLTRAFNNSDTAFAYEFADLSKIATYPQYRAALNAYSGKAAQAQSLAYINSAASILGSGMGCPAFADQGVRFGEGSCIWLKTSAQQSNQWGNGDTLGYRVGSFTTRIGGQKEFLPDWYIGATAAIGTTSSSEDGTENGDSDGSGTTYDGSIAVKHWMGPWLFAGSAMLADGEYHSDRFVTLPGTDVSLKGDPSLFMAGTRARAGREFAFTNFYLLPYGDMDLLYTDLRGFRETGPAPYALNFKGGNKVTVALSPMIELGGRAELNSKLTLRPFLTLGGSFIPDDTRSVEAGFAGTQAADGLFHSELNAPVAAANLGVGLELYRVGGLDLRAEYDATISGTFMSESASAKLAYRF